MELGGRLVVALHTSGPIGGPLMRQMAAGTAIVPRLAIRCRRRTKARLLGVAAVAGGGCVDLGTVGLVAAFAHAVLGHDVAAPSLDPMAAGTVVPALLTIPIVIVGIVTQPAIDLSVLDLIGRHQLGLLRGRRSPLVGGAVTAAALVDHGAQLVILAVDEPMAREAPIRILRRIRGLILDRLVQSFFGVAIDTASSDTANAVLVRCVAIETGPLQGCCRMAPVTGGRRDQPPRCRGFGLVAVHTTAIGHPPMIGTAASISLDELPTKADARGH
jgi:hypothetical protein